MSDELAIESTKPVKLIVGLGNPGTEYAGNRHNIGFMVIDRLLKRQGAKVRKKCQSYLAEFDVGSRSIFLQQPVTYMNSSGDAVRKLCRRENISPAEILVVYDDLDLKPGRLRLRFGGGSGGHNGIKSLTERLGTADYGRLKLGIGRPGSTSAVIDYVLQDFAESEIPLLDEVIETAINVVLMLCNEGYEAAMNNFNGKAVECLKQPNQE